MSTAPSAIRASLFTVNERGLRESVLSTRAESNLELKCGILAAHFDSHRCDFRTIANAPETGVSELSQCNVHVGNPGDEWNAFPDNCIN